MAGGKELWGRGKLDGGYAGTLLNGKLGGGGENGGEINGTWLTSRWCTPGEKFALFVYDWEKMREKGRRPGSFISMFREPRYHVYTRVLVTRNTSGTQETFTTRQRLNAEEEDSK